MNYPYKTLNNNFDLFFRNIVNDNFGFIGTDIKNLQEQLNNLVIGSGNANAEVTQAHVDANGNNFPTIKGRIDAFQSSAETNIAALLSEMVAARTDESGTAFANLKARIDSILTSKMRRVHFSISISNGAATVTYRKGSEYVQNISSDPSGILITFRNVPSGTVPFLQIAYTSSEGFKIDATRSIGYAYMRVNTSSQMTIGLKETSSASMPNTSMSSILSGSAEIKIDL
ncbi:hypothetical protein P4639_14605 [Priestia megaterium]|uniref:hypothetical protein n=1 Tax=Priestia megaterium TaxID=1404 RepID=UPI002E1D7BE0|nr:hypothetical protein [Priestia megaterium]